MLSHEAEEQHPQATASEAEDRPSAAIGMTRLNNLNMEISPNQKEPIGVVATGRRAPRGELAAHAQQTFHGFIVRGEDASLPQKISAQQKSALAESGLNAHVLVLQSAEKTEMTCVIDYGGRPADGGPSDNAYYTVQRTDETHMLVVVRTRRNLQRRSRWLITTAHHAASAFALAAALMRPNWSTSIAQSLRTTPAGDSPCDSRTKSSSPDAQAEQGYAKGSQSCPEGKHHFHYTAVCGSEVQGF